MSRRLRRWRAALAADINRDRIEETPRAIIGVHAACTMGRLKNGRCDEQCDERVGTTYNGAAMD